jgi:hypothetical protein
VAAEFITNLKMIFLPNYSRTERLGELYERHIFSRTIQCDDKTEQKQKRRKNKWWLNKLFIHPLGEDGKLIERFNPKTHNWQRRHKVPTLILNATTLNTGHNWQFTASWMGEPPAAIDTEIDANYRLRRMYYDEAPKRYRNVRLGHAVAASSCVPGLLEPLGHGRPLRAEARNDRNQRQGKGREPGRAPSRWRGKRQPGSGRFVRAGLQCRDRERRERPDGGAGRPQPGIDRRSLASHSVLMARVRHAEYQDLKARLSSSLLRGLVFLHLRKDLGAKPVDRAIGSFCR